MTTPQGGVGPMLSGSSMTPQVILRFFSFFFFFFGHGTPLGGVTLLRRTELVSVAGMSKAMKAKNKEREDAAVRSAFWIVRARTRNATNAYLSPPPHHRHATSQEASASAYPIIFVFFGKLRDAFRALDNSATLDALVEKLKAAGNVEDDRLPQYPLKEFVRLALEFLASPPPPTAPFSLGSGASSSSSPLGSASGGLSSDALPIVKYERAKKAWRWLPKGACLHTRTHTHRHATAHTNQRFLTLVVWRVYQTTKYIDCNRSSSFSISLLRVTWSIQRPGT